MGIEDTYAVIRGVQPQLNNDAAKIGTVKRNGAKSVSFMSSATKA
jgi:hypothetical protein